MGAAVTGHRDRRGGSQHPRLAAVVHPRQAQHRDRAEGLDLLLAQLDVDRAALRCGAVLERQPVLAQPWRIGGQRRAGRRQCQPYVRPVLTGALPDHRVGFQCQGVPVEHGPVGGPPQCTWGEVAQAQPDRPGGRGLHGQLDVADQLGGLLLAEIHGPLGFAEFDSEGSQPGVHCAELLVVRVALVVHPVQFAGPPGPLGLQVGAFADLPQQIGGEAAEQVKARLQPVTSLPQGRLLVFEGAYAVAQGGVVAGGRLWPARCPAADDPRVEHGRGVIGGQLGMESPVDGQRTDRTETQPLDPGLQVEHDGALDVGPILEARDGGDGEGDRLRGRGHGVCQLLRLPPTRALPVGMRIS